LLTPKAYSPDIVELSVSAWFYRNRTIAGFDNPARSLYVAVREMVENSLDACEDAQVLPEVTVLLRRVDEPNEEEGILSAGPQIFELTVKDNGGGMSQEAIPVLIGKMLAGTKFMQRQSRGTFGLGGSLALLYGQVTTQEPVEVVTGQPHSAVGHRVLMRLDIEKNAPEILEENDITKSSDESGTMISFSLEGDWIRSKRRIIDYFSQTSMIVPNASLLFETPDGDLLRYRRLIESVSTRPEEIAPHPKGVDTEMLKSMLSATRTRSLKSFMVSSFQRVGEATATDLLEKAGFDLELAPDRVTQEGLVKLMNAMASYEKFLPPSAKSLSPAGVDVLEAGIQRLEPDFAVFRQRAPSVHEGHAFIVETGVAYGGSLRPGPTLLRFANRIPLLYDEGSDVSHRVMRNLNLKHYGFKADDPLAFVVHICSTKIPYKTVGKEYIGDVDAVRREVELGFKDCLRELSTRLKKRDRASKKLKRRNRLIGYYRFMAETLAATTGRTITLDKLPVYDGGVDE
jgi:DNA topoisomerase-6 subunit B